MKKANKRILPSLIVLCSAFLLTGCGLSNSSAESKKPQSDSTTAKVSTTDQKQSTKSDSTAKSDSTKPSVDSTKPSPTSPSTPNTPSTPSTPSVPSTPSTSTVKTGTVTLTYDAEKGTVTADKTSGNVGEEVKLTITANEGYKVSEVKANNVVLTGPEYKFALVEGENTVEVTFAELPPVIVEHNITADNGEGFEIKNLSKSKAKKDEVVTFQVEVTNNAKEIDSVKANDVACTEAEGTYSFTMQEADVTIHVTLKDKAVETYDLTLEKEGELKEGDGAKLLTVKIAPEAVATDWVFNTDELNTIGVISELPANHPQKADNVRFFTPVNSGTGYLKVTCTIDGKAVEKKFEITVNADYTKYKEIKTAADFIGLIEKAGTITDKYYLSSNIDLGGRTVNGRGIENHFNGVLDGRGHTVRNFVVNNTSKKEPKQASGLFHMVGGTVRNIHLKGTIADEGFSGLLCKEFSGATALIENCVFEAKNTFTTSDWTWKRNGVIAGVLQADAKVNNVVTNLDAGETGATCMPFFAYTWSKASFTNGYTNIAHDEQYENYKPFNPDGNYNMNGFVTENLTHTPFDSTLKTAYTTLNEEIWNLEDNKMPELKNASDPFVMLEPEVKAALDKTTLSMKDGEKEAVLTVSLENTDKSATYEVTATPNDVVSITDNQDGTFKVTALKEGTTAINVKATIDGKEYTADPLQVTVKGLDAPEYEIPEGAFEIKDVTTFKQVFTGGGEFCNRDFYLSCDIDLTGETLPNNGMAGDFTKTFEGQGHTIKASYNWGLFNILSGTVRNFTLVTEAPSEVNRGAICHTTSGTIENVNVEMTVVEGRATNTFAGMCYLNNGAIKNSNVDFIINTPCNTIKSFAVADGSGSFTNCTYTIAGTWDGKATAVTPNTGTNLKA